MNRTSFAHSRTITEYEDGSIFGTCSINCAVIDLETNSGKGVKRLAVADYNTKKLIDAKSAFWVVGGSKSGVMTRNPKWAFAKEKDAEGFVKSFGGKKAAYDDVKRAVLTELEQRKK
jgi:formylmethanofuran dehydrogenase subunit A